LCDLILLIPAGVDWTSSELHQSLLSAGAVAAHVPLVYLNFRVFHRNDPITPPELEFFTKHEGDICRRAAAGVALSQRDRDDVRLVLRSTRQPHNHHSSLSVNRFPAIYDFFVVVE
jgi:uncharacterized membrane protein